MKPATPNINQSLLSLLNEQEQALNSMLDLLREEYQALSATNREMFDEILDRKAVQTKHLEGLEKEYHLILEKIGGVQDKPSLEAYINSTADSSLKKQLHASWKNFLHTLEQCHDQNMVNYRIVEASRTNVQQTLDMLRGDTGLPKLYGASGKQHGDSQGHSLAIA